MVYLGCYWMFDWWRRRQLKIHYNAMINNYYKKSIVLDTPKNTPNV